MSEKPFEDYLTDEEKEKLNNLKADEQLLNKIEAKLNEYEVTINSCFGELNKKLGEQYTKLENLTEQHKKAFPNSK